MKKRYYVYHTRHKAYGYISDMMNPYALIMEVPAWSADYIVTPDEFKIVPRWKVIWWTLRQFIIKLKQI